MSDGVSTISQKVALFKISFNDRDCFPSGGKVTHAAHNFCLAQFSDDSVQSVSDSPLWFLNGL